MTGSGSSAGRELADLDAPNWSEVVYMKDEDSLDSELTDTSDSEYQELLMKNAEMEEKVSKADERLMIFITGQFCLPCKQVNK